MRVPLALRDALYRRWRACLDDPSLPFEAAAHPAKAAHAAYLADRLPRYRAAFAARGARPLEVAQALLDNGLYFDAHEYLEPFWKAAAGLEKTRLQGVIQLAAAFHKIELDPNAQAGALSLLSAGLEKLEDQRLRDDLGPVLAALRAATFRLEGVPRIKIS